MISLCMPFYNNHGMLAVQRAHWSSFPDDVKRRLEFVICDDASDTPITKGPHNLNIRMFRIVPPKVMWSQCCATNIAANYARGPWLLLTDIDHMVPRETVANLLVMIDNDELDPACAYRFERKELDGSYKKPHPNSWIMHASTFNKSGGHDERLRGLYNQDGTFIERVGRVADIRRLPFHIIRVGRESIADASTPAQYRDPRVRQEMAQRVAQLKAHFKREGTYWKDNRCGALHMEIK